GPSNVLLRAAGLLSGPTALLLRILGLHVPAAIAFLLGALVSRYGWLAAGRRSARDPAAAFAVARPGGGDASVSATRGRASSGLGTDASVASTLTSRARASSTGPSSKSAPGPPRRTTRSPPAGASRRRA